jgi:hypothetical protein
MANRPTLTLVSLQNEVAELQLANLIAPFDGRPPPVYDRDMNAPTREEFNAKLEATEARMDARITSASGKIDTLVAQMAANEAGMSRLSERAVAASERAALASEQAAAAAERAAAAAVDAGGLKSTMWITSITTILAVVGIAFAAYFGTQSSNLSIVGSTISAFEAGRATGDASRADDSATKPVK